MINAPAVLAMLFLSLATVANAKVYRNVSKNIYYTDANGEVVYGSSSNCPVPKCVNSSKSSCGAVSECDPSWGVLAWFPWYVWAIFFAIVLVLAGVGKVFADRKKKAEAEQA